VCIAAEQLGAVSSFLVIVLVPFFNTLIFPALHSQPWRCLQPQPLRQMAVGMQLAAAAFVASAVVQSFVDAAAPQTITVLWQLPQIILITTAEILVYGTGLEFAYSQVRMGCLSERK
jgi:proton-dependent oligopeptide transporter, POT family